MAKIVKTRLVNKPVREKRGNSLLEDFFGVASVFVAILLLSVGSFAVLG